MTSLTLTHARRPGGIRQLARGAAGLLATGLRAAGEGVYRLFVPAW
ncbi:MAG: hypothetical protein Q8O14_03590 [bacterium]|jgi:hypothetical protein|nr:hypothetical protein [bacterium]